MGSTQVGPVGCKALASPSGRRLAPSGFRFTAPPEPSGSQVLMEMDHHAMTENQRFRRAAAVAEQQRGRAAELMHRVDALCDAADHRMQRSSELQADTGRRLRQGIATGPIRSADTSYVPWTSRAKPRSNG